MSTALLYMPMKRLDLDIYVIKCKVLLSLKVPPQLDFSLVSFQINFVKNPTCLVSTATC